MKKYFVISKNECVSDYSLTEALVPLYAFESLNDIDLFLELSIQSVTFTEEKYPSTGKIYYSADTSNTIGGELLNIYSSLRSVKFYNFVVQELYIPSNQSRIEIIDMSKYVQKPIVLLNTSILTEFGSFEYKPIELDKAKDLIKQRGFVSAIGHESTASVMSSLLEENITMNRIEFKQQLGDTCLVFKLKGRPQEGKLLSKEEIETIGYEFGILRMV